MKLLFTALLCLLFTGCAADTHADAPTEAPPVPEAVVRVQGQYGSAVEVISLPLPTVQQIRTTGGGFLLQSDRDLVLTDRSGAPVASRQLDFVPQIQSAEEVIAAYDPASRQQLLLDLQLEPLRTLTLPGNISGTPLFSATKNALYYAAGKGIYCWELDTGIRRRIRENTEESQELISLHCADSVLQCRTPEGDWFLDAGSGQLLYQLPVNARLTTASDRYYCTFPAGAVDNHIFRQPKEETQCLIPEDPSAEVHFLPHNHSAVTLSQCTIHWYDLETGLLRDTLALSHTPKAVLESEDSLVLWITEQDQDLLLRWNPGTASQSRDYTDLYYPASAPDAAGLAQCQDYARRLQDLWGIEILLGKDAVLTAPWDYTFTPEHRYHVLLSQLQTLERALARYPKEVLTQTASHFDSLTICLVQSITGISTDSLSAATGIQFLEENHAYLALAAGAPLEQAIYHELFHLMEIHILGHSNALDRWNALNPAGFSYDLDLGTNATRNSGVYLAPGSRAFVDTYSMSFPKEDRARIFEYAMLPDREHLFQSQTMQKKLSAICTGIREAYTLKTCQEELPWEQYLQ